MQNKQQPILSFTELSVTTRNAKTDNALSLLNNCTASVNEGDKISLIGRSGSGKSLLLKAIAGLLPITQGKLYLYGTPHLHYKKTQWHIHIGLIGQEALMQAGTVLDNLQLPFQYSANKSQVFDQQWHEQNLQLFDKSPEFLAKPANTLSGGEKQIVNLLRGLQRNPQLLLLDEPTASLDKETGETLIQIVNAWHTQNPKSAIIWISHDTKPLLDTCNKNWQMDNGCLNACHTSSQIQEGA